MSRFGLWPRRTFVTLTTMAVLFAGHLRADDTLTRVKLQNSEGETTVEGKVLIEAADKSFLMMARDGRLWSVPADEVVERTATEEPFTPASREELSKELLEEMGSDFTIVSTKHYLICTNTDKKYAKWCGVLFERLMAAFRGHWKNTKIEMHEPEMPLVAIVFANRRQFAEYATRDQGATTSMSLGYYSTRTNRIAIYDLTADVGGRPGPGGDVGTQLEASLTNVATVVHEATHQMAFNCGMHTRYAENPLWLVEGMAMYFETPDVRSSTGWKTLGQINPARLRTFKNSIRKDRPTDSLETLITDDKRLSEPLTALEAYAESWALTYFLVKTRRKQYTEYLQNLAKKPRLKFGTPADRLAEFRDVFGDLEKLDQEFVRYISRL